jgi:hypothetical protein
VEYLSAKNAVGNEADCSASFHATGANVLDELMESIPKEEEGIA